MTKDTSFLWSRGLERAVSLLRDHPGDPVALPDDLPQTGVGDLEALERLAPNVLGMAESLDAPTALAHMDPPTPWITWAMAMWNARLNQNLLHPSTSPFAREAEARVIGWLAPIFGMAGGHCCCGSTLANLTALWAARDAAGAETVVASDAAHVSVRKSAKLLGMGYRAVRSDDRGRLSREDLGDLASACLVLTAGTTSAGAVDELDLDSSARWTHVDAAWAGPMRLSHRYAAVLDGIDHHDSVSISSHKWFFQPKESALVLFRDPDRANEVISLDGGYLAAPNVGVQGSRGAAAIPLLATLLAWGREGMARRIDHAMGIADRIYHSLDRSDQFETWQAPTTGVNVFRPKIVSPTVVAERLPAGMFSRAEVAGETWLRSVAANPMADPERIVALLESAVPEPGRPPTE